MARAAALACCLEAVLESRGNANRVFEILELLAVRAGPGWVGRAGCGGAALGLRAVAGGGAGPRPLLRDSLPQGQEEEEVLCAARTCSRLFGALLERGELFVGPLPAEKDSLAGEGGAGASAAAFG